MDNQDYIKHVFITCNPSYITSLYIYMTRTKNQAAWWAGAVELHRLYLCGGVKLPQWVCWIWHLTIRYRVSSVWSFEEYGVTPSLPLLPGLLWSRVVALDRVLSIGQNCPVDRGYRIRRLLLYRGVRPPKNVVNMTLNNLMVSFQ